MALGVVVWRWEEKHARGRWRRLSWMMNEERARQHAEHDGVEPRKVEGSHEERTDLYGNGHGGNIMRTPGT